MSKVKYLAATECTIDGKLFQPGQGVPFANARMVESGMVKCVLDEAAEPTEAPADEAEVLTEKSSDVEVLTEEESEEEESEEESEEE